MQDNADQVLCSKHQLLPMVLSATVTNPRQDALFVHLHVAPCFLKVCCNRFTFDMFCPFGLNYA